MVIDNALVIIFKIYLNTFLPILKNSEKCKN